MATVHLYRAVKQLTDQWLIWSCSQVSELITVMNDLQPLTVDSPQCSGPYVITELLEVLCCSGLT